MDTLPKHRGYPLFKSTFHIIGDLLGFPEIQTQKLGPVFRADAVLGPLIYALDPQWVQIVLEKHHLNYKKSVQYEVLKFSLGDGLLTSEGDSWKHQRKTLQPMFMKESLAKLCQQVESATDELIGRWRGQDAIMDVNHETNQFALDVACRAFLGVSAAGTADQLDEWVQVINQFSMNYLKMPLPVPLWVPRPMNLKFKQARRQIWDMIMGLMQAHKKGDLPQDNMIHMLIESGHFDDVLLRDELITFLVAGHETTSNALTFTLHSLLSNPDCVAQVKAELKQHFNPSLSMDIFKQLPYTTAVIKESLRLYPPAWIIGRQAIADDEILGHHIRKNTNIVMPVYNIHRLPEYWEDPLRFNPERFLGEAEKSRPKFVYLPFGGGSRFCIGQQLAMLELLYVIGRLFSDFEMRLLSDDLALEPLISLQPKYKISIGLTAKN